MDIDVKTLNQAEEFEVEILEPGLVSYVDEDKGVWLYTSEFISAYLKTLLGKSLTINHIPDADKDGSQTTAHGIVSEINPEMSPDGKYRGKVLAWTPQAKEYCKKGFGVSVGVGDVTYDNTPGTWHGLDYSAKLVAAEFTHLALTDKPRLEGMSVLVNSKEARLYNSKEGVMKFKVWLKKMADGLKNSLDGSAVEIDGKQVSIKELVDTYEAEQAEIAAKKEAEGKEVLENASLKFGEKEYKVADLVNCYKAKGLKNAEAEETAKKAQLEKEAADKAAKEKAGGEPKLENSEAEAKAKKDAEDKAAKEKLDNDQKTAAEKEAAEKAAKEKLNNAKKEDDFELLNSVFEAGDDDKGEAKPNTQEVRLKRAEDYFSVGMKAK
jgi:hypothetical protein